MGCTKCNELKTSICDQTPCTEPQKCDCPVLNLQTKCIIFEGDDLPITGIKKNTIETSMWQQMDAYLGKLKTDLINAFQMVNIGSGAKVFKGIDLLGRKELRTVKTDDTLILVTENTNDIGVRINPTTLTSFVANLIPIPQIIPNITSANVGTGLGLIFRDKIANVLNFRKIKVVNTGVGVSILNAESTVGDDILISAKKLKSSDGSVLITETTNEINLLSKSNIPDGSETKVTAGTNVEVTGIGTIANPYIVNSTLTVASTQIRNGVTTSVSGNGMIVTPFVIETTNPQKIVTENYTLSNSDNNYVVFIDTVSDITITIPTGLLSNFQCGFIQETAFETTFVAVVGVTLNNPIGFRMRGQKYNTFLEKKLTTDVYYLLGNTKV